MAEEYIGNYRVLKKIGAGGMARVYLGVHQDVANLKVVLKILSDPSHAERFKQEADKLALLDGHPSICRIKHFFNHGDDTVIAMEYIEGTTLDEIIKNKGRLPVEESVRIINEVLDTLEFAHEKRIFHRDIKPSNIMIDQQGRVKIIDFGIAKAETDPSLTVAGSCCGTPAYMAPEQFTPTEQTDYALTDIYAVGTTLFYMLCGQLPFTGANEFAIRDAKLFNEPPRPRTLNNDIPAKIEDIILRAMKSDPGERFQRASDMKRALQQAVDIGPQQRGQPVVSPEITQSGKTGTGSGRKKVIPLLTGGIVVVGIAIAAFLFWPENVQLTPPNPVSPWNESVIDYTSQPTFVWSAVPGARSYSLELSPDTSFDNAERFTGIVDTSYKPAQDLANADYFWRLQAHGSGDERSAYSARRLMTVAMPPPEPAEGSIVLSVNGPSDIYVDNTLESRNSRRAEITVDTGWHQVRISNSQSNEKSQSDSVYVGFNQTVTRQIAFTFPQETDNRPPAEPKKSKLVTLSIPPGGVIFVDGILQEGVHTPYTLTLEAGQHRVKVVMTDDESNPMEKTVDARAGAEKRIMFNFDENTVLFPF